MRWSQGIVAVRSAPANRYPTLNALHHSITLIVDKNFNAVTKPLHRHYPQIPIPPIRATEAPDPQTAERASSIDITKFSSDLLSTPS